MYGSQRILQFHLLVVTCVSHQRAQRKVRHSAKEPNFIVKCWHCLRAISPRRHGGRRHINDDERPLFFLRRRLGRAPLEREREKSIVSFRLFDCVPASHAFKSTHSRTTSIDMTVFSFYSFICSPGVCTRRKWWLANNLFFFFFFKKDLISYLWINNNNKKWGNVFREMTEQGQNNITHRLLPQLIYETQRQSNNIRTEKEQEKNDARWAPPSYMCTPGRLYCTRGGRGDGGRPADSYPIGVHDASSTWWVGSYSSSASLPPSQQLKEEKKTFFKCIVHI